MKKKTSEKLNQITKSINLIRRVFFFFQLFALLLALLTAKVRYFQAVRSIADIEVICFLRSKSVYCWSLYIFKNIYTFLVVSPGLDWLASLSAKAKLCDSTIKLCLRLVKVNNLLSFTYAIYIYIYI